MNKFRITYSNLDRNGKRFVTTEEISAPDERRARIAIEVHRSSRFSAQGRLRLVSITPASAA